MTNKTPLYDAHLKSNGKMVDFAGWSMPIHYGSQINEHQAVRNQVGMFDVSHMLAVDLIGEQVKAFLQFLLANDVAKLYPGKALYSCMLNESGGVIDDLIVYCIEDNHFRIVVNAGTRDKDTSWMQQHAERFSVRVTPRTDLAIIAVQGPEVTTVITKLSEAWPFTEALALKKFHAQSLRGYFVAKTGYTGEDGFEMMLPAEQAEKLWNDLLVNDVQPCGLGARDTLRLEAGMNLYSQDMDESTTPLESNLAWTVDFKDASRNFIGKTSLLEQQNNLQQQMVGLILTDKGVMRSGYKVITDKGDGVITSGTFSPTLEKSIALARIPIGVDSKVQIEVRNKLLSAEICTVPFIK